MTITAIILAAVVVGGTGLFIGVFLGIAGKKFAVEVDEREEAILGTCRLLSVRVYPPLLLPFIAFAYWLYFLCLLLC